MKRYKYKNGEPVFQKNERGDEIYAINEYTGDQVYPKKGHPFAKDRFGQEYYAKNVHGDEILPLRKKLSVLIYRNNVPIIPRQKSGKQTYPKDVGGNEYYLVDSESKEPFLLRDKEGEIFFAKTHSGIPIIPSSYFYREYERKSNENYYLFIDAARNVVYSEGERVLNPNIVIGCICAYIMNMPELLSSILSRLKI